MPMGVRSVVLAPVRMALEWITMRLVEKRVVRGVLVADMRLDDSSPGAYETVIEVIELIHRHDPARVRRMARDVRYVAVTRTVGTGGEYRERSRSILLNESAVARQPREAVAMTVVHEATQARLCRMGVGRFPDLGRIERTCVEAEIAFARKLPDPERLIDAAGRKLASRYWEQPRHEAFEKYLEGLGYPRWARWLMRPRSGSG
jgi:hypothetical protein